MRYIDLCLQSVKVVILPMLTVFRIVAKCLCIDLNFFFLAESHRLFRG